MRNAGGFWLRLCCGLVAMAFAALADPPAACASDTVFTLAPGIEYVHRLIAGVADVQILSIDLAVPGVRIAVTSRSQRWSTVLQFARRTGATAAVNASSWSLFTQRAQGYVSGGGQVWSARTRRDVIFGITRQGRATILTPRDGGAALEDITDGVAGNLLLVDKGRLADPAGLTAMGRDARTAVGVSRNGTMVVIATADGRRPGAIGATPAEMGRLLMEFGAWRGINLDGGKSVAMFVARDGGIVNNPVLGREREVVSHIGVYAPLLDGQARAARVLETPAAFVQLMRKPVPPSPRPVRSMLSDFAFLDDIYIGTVREWLFPVACLVLALLFYAGLLAGARRRRRRQARLRASDDTEALQA